MTVNIKYCGGCNPRFDRAEIVRRLKEKFPFHTYLINTRESTDAVVILCGCSAACADVTDCYGVYGRFVLWNESAWESLCDFINSIDREKRNCL